MLVLRFKSKTPLLKSMNRNLKLLALVLSILIATTSIEAYLLSTTTNKNTQPSPIRVACIGDSITRGTEYTLDLWHLLGATYIVGDFGVGGTTVCNSSGSGYMNETAFELAKKFQPNIVIIMLGTNDANPNLNESNALFIADYVKLLTEFQSLDSKPQVYLVLPPPIHQNNVNLSQRTLLQNVIPNIKEVARQTSLPLIDAHTPLVEYPEYFIDGIHPDVQGAKAIAEAVYKTIAQDINIR